jgi:hypothetical protein
MKTQACPAGLVLVLLGGLALVGCGSDSNASPASATPAAPVAGAYVAFVGDLKSMDGDILKVGKDDVQTNSYTLIFRNSAQIHVSQLHIGETLRVKGWFNDNATTVVARQIIVESEG